MQPTRLDSPTAPALSSRESEEAMSQTAWQCFRHFRASLSAELSQHRPRPLCQWATPGATAVQGAGERQEGRGGLAAASECSRRRWGVSCVSCLLLLGRSHDRHTHTPLSNLEPRPDLGESRERRLHSLAGRTWSDLHL